MEQHSSRAPVEVPSTIEIAASPGIVWSVLADIEGWPGWNPAVREVTVDGEVAVGTHFRWATGPGAVTSQLTAVESPARLAWSGSFMTLSHAQEWLIEPTPTGSTVSVQTSISGLLARLFRRRLEQGQRSALDAWLALLRLEAEARRSA